MSKLPTENRTQSNAAGGIRFVLLTTALLISYASNSFANRPSMQDENAEYIEPASEPAISAVEIMMQQQTQQTGDVLNLPAQEIQPGETIRIQLLDMPRRGTSMTRVKQEFGEPMDASDSIGKPPITSWIYPDRIVYFEYSTVLHVVAR